MNALHSGRNCLIAEGALERRGPFFCPGEKKKYSESLEVYTPAPIFAHIKHNGL